MSTFIYKRKKRSRNESPFHQTKLLQWVSNVFVNVEASYTTVHYVLTPSYFLVTNWMMWHEIHKLNYVAQNSMTGLRVPQQIVYYFDHRYLQLESSIIVHIIIILVSRLANQTTFPFYLWRRKGPQYCKKYAWRDLGSRKSYQIWWLFWGRLLSSTFVLYIVSLGGGYSVIYCSRYLSQTES